MREATPRAEVREPHRRDERVRLEAHHVGVEAASGLQVADMRVEVADGRPRRQWAVELAVVEVRKHLPDVERLGHAPHPSVAVPDRDRARTDGDLAGALRCLERQLELDPVRIAEIGRLGEDVVGRRLRNPGCGDPRKHACELLLVGQVDRDVVEAGVPAQWSALGARMEDDQGRAVDAEAHLAAGPVELGEADRVAPEGERPIAVEDVEVDGAVGDLVGVRRSACDEGV